MSLELVKCGPIHSISLTHALHFKDQEIMSLQWHHVVKIDIDIQLCLLCFSPVSFSSVDHCMLQTEQIS
jgi:hypothetical protein